MFNEAARKFYEKFQLGKVYYISKGTLKVANKQYKTVKNDYEMTLNENSVVEEAANEETFIPETKFNFVPIDQLGPYVNGRELVGKNSFLDVYGHVYFSLFISLCLTCSLTVIFIVLNFRYYCCCSKCYFCIKY